MGAIQSAFSNGYGSLPVLSGTVAVNEIPVASSASAATWALGLVQQAATAVGGFALQNATPTIISWTPPNDGKEHRFFVMAALNVTSIETGGAVGVTFQPPTGGFTPDSALLAGGLGTGSVAGNVLGGVVGAGTTIFVHQTSVLSGGAATAWAEIWGS